MLLDDTTFWTTFWTTLDTSWNIQLSLSMCFTQKWQKGVQKGVQKVVKNRVSGHDESTDKQSLRSIDKPILTSGEDDILDLFFDPKTIESALQMRVRNDLK